MRMTNKLASTLMECFAAVAISANGGVSMDKNGRPIFTDEQRIGVEKYARDTFVSLLEEWEDLMGEEWEILEEGEE